MQAQEAQQQHQNDDKLKLDEILAICAEYEEQIAKEIEENKAGSSSCRPKLPLTSSLISLTRPVSSGSCSSNGANNISSCNGEQNNKSPGTPNSCYSR
jgi:hypothetical protein